MVDPMLLEETYQRMVTDLPKWIPDGIININIDTLHALDLVHCDDGLMCGDSKVKDTFQVFESEDKITLVNEKFIIWLAPQVVGRTPCTLVVIGTNHGTHVHPELAFVTRGVYNTSRYVLRIVEKYLKELEEMEQLIGDLSSDC